MGTVVRPQALPEFRNVAAVLGFLLKAEVDAIFKQHPFRTPSGEDHLDLWRRFDQQRQALTAAPIGDLLALPHSLAPVEAAIRSRQTFKTHYEAVADWTFFTAPIDALLAPQWYADLDYVAELRSKLTPSMSEAAQLEYAFAEGRIYQPMVIGNQVIFSSARRDLYADQIPTVRQTAGGDFEILVTAASRPNYVQVAHLGNRLLLTNGVHKVCALREAGFTRCFCVVRTVQTFAETGLNPQSTTLFRDPLFQGPRPALVLDFLNPATAAPLLMRSASQILQVAVTIATATIPALPKDP